MRFVLASASPARLGRLRAAGVDPLVRVSGVDEDAVAAAMDAPTPAELVLALALAKARDVVGEVAAEIDGPAVVVGCDSMLSFDGEVVGKPGTEDVARERWGRMAGGSGELLTGHAVLRVADGEVCAEATGTQTTTVYFGRPSDAELSAYLATGEPLRVAGAFTIDALGGWFVEGIDGDPSSVIGISLPLTRRLLAEVGVDLVAVWSGRQTRAQEQARS